jgi:hypothetical protein
MKKKHNFYRRHQRRIEKAVDRALLLLYVTLVIGIAGLALHLEHYINLF